MIFDFLTYSFNSLRIRKTRTLLTMIGIFIGIAAVVSLISLGSGFQKAVLSQFSDVGTDKLTVQAAETGFGPPGSTAVKRLNDDDFDAIRKVSGVKAAAKRYIRAAKATFKEKTLVVVASSIPQDKDGRTLVVDALNLDVADGRFLEIDDSNKILVGNGFYENEKFPKKVFTGDKIDINGYDFEVVGILEKSGNPQFNDLFLLNEKDLEKVLDIEDEMDLVVVQVTNVNDIEKVSNDINRELRKTRDVEEGKEDFSISTPQETLESVNTILNVVQIVIIGIAGISLVVGGIGIMNTMYTAVLERRREIGIMKSVGARNSDILIIFIIESGILGFVGGVIGVILGVGFSKFVEIAATLALGPGILAADISLGLIIGSLSFSFFVGTISGILPAKQASDLQPVDALRQ
ncbi:ABC transporter permease [Candidatus Woesearchaeota archaeon]|nr:ABC transporter permease [Candidatus Woesearchaeota archaeon]